METLEEAVTKRKEIRIDLTDLDLSTASITATTSYSEGVYADGFVMIPSRPEYTNYTLKGIGGRFNAIAEHYLSSEEYVSIILEEKNDIQVFLSGRIDSIGLDVQDNVNAFGITFC